MTGFVPASEYRRTTAPTPATDAPAVVEGYECPLSGYILTSDAIARGYCDTCPRRSRSEIGTIMCGRVS